MGTRVFNDEQEKFIREHVKGHSSKELMQLVNDTFGLSISQQQIRTYMRNRKLKNGIDCRFKPGCKPFNKGRKMPNHGGKETQFKKGSVPPNRRPIGSERIDSKDGYVHVKVQDGHKNDNWKPKHILVWEEHNGPIPKGHVIIFGDGNNRNFEPDNLICISRGKLATLNRWLKVKNDSNLTKSALLVCDIMSLVKQTENSA